MYFNVALPKRPLASALETVALVCVPARRAAIWSSLILRLAFAFHFAAGHQIVIVSVVQLLQYSWVLRALRSQVNPKLISLKPPKVMHHKSILHVKTKVLCFRASIRLAEASVRKTRTKRMASAGAIGMRLRFVLGWPTQHRYTARNMRLRFWQWVAVSGYTIPDAEGLDTSYYRSTIKADPLKALRKSQSHYQRL